MFIVVSPLLGMLLGGGMMVLVAWMLPAQAARHVDRWFRRAAARLGGAVQPRPRRQRRAEDDGHHLALLIAKGHLHATSADVPLWVILSCQLAMGLGTLSGGWRIVKTMGMRITKLKPVGGFCAETGAAGMLFLASALGVPVSTTHTITGASSASARSPSPSSVRWGVACRIVWAWLFTIQSAALIAAGIYTALRAPRDVTR